MKRGSTRAVLLFAYLGNIDLADYLHSDGSSIIGSSDFLKSFDDTSTVESSQWLDYSLVEAARFSREGLDCQNLLPTPISSSIL
jgi:hypothetical protein